jgi:hypothetical protein
MTHSANHFGGIESSESEPSSCFAPRDGPKLLSNRILIAGAEKGKRKFAKNFIF